MSEDYSDFDEVIAPDANQLRSIEQLVLQAHNLMMLIDTHEAALKTAKAELVQLTHKSIPDAMAAAGTSNFTTDKGVKVSIKEILNGTLPKDPAMRTAALKWLEEHEGRSIIKGTITAEFERGEDNSEKRNRAAEALSALSVNFVEQEGVHPQTLAAYARERIKNGEEVPLDLLGLYSGRMAKIVIP
jgi:hypothetical protein